MVAWRQVPSATMHDPRVAERDQAGYGVSIDKDKKDIQQAALFTKATRVQRGLAPRPCSGMHGPARFSYRLIREARHTQDESRFAASGTHRRLAWRLRENSLVRAAPAHRGLE